MTQERADRPQVSVKIELERLEGVTFADALHTHPDKEEHLVFLPDAPLKFYDDVEDPEFSEDKKHAIAVAYDGQRRILIRDYEEVLTVEGGSLEIEARNKDLSRLLVCHLTEDRLQDIYFIDGQAVTRVTEGHLETDLEESSESLDWFIYLLQPKEGTSRIVAYKSAPGGLPIVVVNEIQTETQVLDGVRLLMVSEDLKTIISREEMDNGHHYRLNNLSLGIGRKEAPATIKANDDYSHVLVAIPMEDAVSVWQAKDNRADELIRASGSLDVLLATPSVDLAVVVVKGQDEKSQYFDLYTITPESGMGESLRVDQITSYPSVEGNRIEAGVVINGKRHKLVISREEAVGQKETVEPPEELPPAGKFVTEHGFAVGPGGRQGPGMFGGHGGGG